MRADEGDKGTAWEQTAIGPDIESRLLAVGQSSLDWRARAGYEKSELAEDAMVAFNRRVHTWGKHVLQMQRVDDDTFAAAPQRVSLAKQEGHAARARLKKRNIRVADNEDVTDVVAIRVDKEWNTAAWTDDMVCDGVKHLFDLFYDSRKVSQASTDLACTMLVKLVSRHPPAEAYVREHIGQLAGLAANRFLKGGKSAGVLDLLHIIHVCKERFVPELSDCMIVFRIFNMMGLEMHLAATIIQHLFRQWHFPKKQQRRVAKGTILPITQTFGDETEVQASYYKAIADRTKELKARWCSMHVWMHPLERAISIGRRGPAYIGAPFTHVCLDIVRTLVGDAGVARGLANANRGDLINSTGCEFLSQCLGCLMGPFAPAAAAILAHTAKVPESLPYMVGSGCVMSCITHVSMLLDLNKVSFLFSAIPDRSLDMLAKTDRNRHPLQIAKVSFWDCMGCLAHTATHTAGIFRAKNRYNYIKQCEVLGEEVDYLEYYHRMSHALTIQQLQNTVGSPKLLSILFRILRTSPNLNAVRICLRILCSLAGSDCHRMVLMEACLEGGTNLNRLIELLEESDSTVHSLSLTVLLQLNCVDYGRHKLMFVNLPQMISAAIKPRENCMHGPFLRSLFATASCLRQSNWRFYEPTSYPLHVSNSDHVREAIYLDLLKTITNSAENIDSDRFTIADLVVLPIDWTSAHKLSVIAESVGARELAYWLAHPFDNDYFSRLPWEEGIAGCIILDALSSNIGTLENLYSTKIANYLGQCLHLSRFLFSAKKAMGERQAQVVLTGVRSAATALGRMCSYCKTESDRDALVLQVRSSDLLGGAHFYVSTLGTNHPLVDKELVTLQVYTGLSVVYFFMEYCRMVCDMKSVGEAKQDELLREAFFTGKTAAKLLSTTKKVFGSTPRAQAILTALCDFLTVVLGRSRHVVDLAITQWKIFAALRDNLPMPLSTIDINAIDSSEFLSGLYMIPASFFTLVSTMCQYDVGRALAINDGILKRALEIVTVLMPHRARGATKAGGLPKRPPKLEGRDLNSIDVEENDDGTKFAKKIASCLSLIAELGTFADSGSGSANDIILHPQYELVENCQRILNDPLYEKNSEMVTAALNVLASLSKDSHNVCGDDGIFQKLDIMTTFTDYLHHAASMTDSAIGACINAISRLIPINTDYVTKRLQQIVLPLTRVNRLKPSFNKHVLDTIWAIALRLNSFSTGEEHSKDRHKRRVVHALHEHSDWADATVFTGEMKKVLEEDTVLAKQLAAIYKDAGIDPTQPPERKRNALKIAKMFVSSLGAAAPGSIKVGNEKEWHNPSFEEAKEMASPLEMRHRNFVTDIAAEAGIESAFVPRSSPHSLEAFRKSSYGASLQTEFAKSPDKNEAVRYCLSEVESSKDKGFLLSSPALPVVVPHGMDSGAAESLSSQSLLANMEPAPPTSAWGSNVSDALPSVSQKMINVSSPKPKLAIDCASPLAILSIPSSPASQASAHSSPSIMTSPLSPILAWKQDASTLWDDNSPTKDTTSSLVKSMPSLSKLTTSPASERTPKRMSKKKGSPKKKETSIAEYDTEEAPELMMTRPKGAMVHIM